MSSPRESRVARSLAHLLGGGAFRVGQRKGECSQLWGAAGFVLRSLGPGHPARVGGQKGKKGEPVSNVGLGHSLFTCANLQTHPSTAARQGILCVCMCVCKVLVQCQWN